MLPSHGTVGTKTKPTFAGHPGRGFCFSRQRVQAVVCRSAPPPRSPRRSRGSACGNAGTSLPPALTAAFLPFPSGGYKETSPSAQSQVWKNRQKTKEWYKPDESSKSGHRFILKRNTANHAVFLCRKPQGSSRASSC